jgi:hypothetical protein
VPAFDDPVTDGNAASANRLARTRKIFRINDPPNDDTKNAQHATDNHPDTFNIADSNAKSAVTELHEALFISGCSAA